jgi:hypothetical protein
MKDFGRDDKLNDMQSRRHKILYPISITYPLPTEHNNSQIKTNLPPIISDFQCFVCGAIFTTDEDRKQHLEKEALGILLASSDQEIEIAKSQEAINENRRHYF